jgi:hypothetical protein
MSDLTKMKEMLDEAKIPYKEIDASENYAGEGVHTELSVEGGKGDTHWLGYSDFVVSMYFEDDGSLVKMGAWE